MTERETDIQLMRRVQAGDLDMLQVLYSRHHLRLRTFLYRFTGNSVHSEDIVQTVFLRILKHRDGFSGKGSFSAWIYRIARNAALDRIKSESLRRTSSLTDLDPPWSGANAHDQAETSEKWSMLEQALRNLRPDRREVLSLSKVDCLTCREIAAILGCREGTVKVRIFRAMRELREEVDRLRNGEKK